MFAELRRRVIHLFSRDGFDRELQEEIQLHKELRAAKLRHAGVPDDDAKIHAQRQFGNELSLREASREMWGWRALDTLLQDIGYALRQMRTNKGFTAVAIATLALSIAGAIFSVFEAIILRSLPVPNPEELRLVQVSGDGLDSSFSHPLFRRMSDALPAGAQLAAMTGIHRGQIVLSGGSAEAASFQLVSASFFDTLKVQPSIGLLFNKRDDESAGAHPVAVISHNYWMRCWSSSPDVLGKTVSVNGQPLTVIGVAAPGFTGTRIGESVDIWVPLAMQWNVRHFDNVSSYGSSSTTDTTKPWAPQENIFWLQLISRIPRDIKTNSVSASLDVIFKRMLGQVYGNDPDAEEKRRRLAQKIVIVPGNRGVGTLRDRFLTPLNALLAMSGLVLLIACANIASLLMSRAESRQREIAVRMSIGASRARLIRQLFTESLVLALFGSAIGGFAGMKFGPALSRLLNGGTIAVDLSPNLSALAFTLALCALTTVAFGLVPALRSTQVELASALKLAGGTKTPGSQASLGQTMICAQVALSVILLVLAGLFSRTLYNLANTDPGYQASHLLSVGINSQLGGYKEAELLPLYQRLENELGEVPGVTAVSVAQCTLASGGGCGQYSSMYAQGFVPVRGQEVQVQELFVGWNYLETMGLQLLRGRPFAERDKAGSQRVVIVNQTLARYYFGHDEVVGKRIGYSYTDPKQFEIIGVLRDTPVNNFRERIPRFVLHPIAQEPHPVRTINVRAQGDPAAIASAVRLAVRKTAPSLPVYGVRTMTEQIHSTFTQERAVAWLSRLFSGLATALACLGLYGLLSYRVSRRTSEIGIRMALGAKPASVQWLVLRNALSWTLAGLTIGLVLSVAATRSLRGLLFGVSNTDPLTYVAVLIALIMFALLASLVPARRAARIDPMTALRVE